MILKHHISFKLRPYGKDQDSFQIQMHTTFNGLRLKVSTGCQLSSAAAWSAGEQLVNPGYAGPKGETAITINNALRNCREQMETSIKYFEANDINPTVKQLSEKYLGRMHGVTPKRPETEPKPKKENKPKEKSFWEYFDIFCSECGEKNAWTLATHEKMDALKVDLQTFKKNLSFSSLTESTLTAFVVYLRDTKKLHSPRKKKGDREKYDSDDIIGLKNSTIDKKLGYLRWFLNWAADKGYNTNLAYKTFRPTLKQTQKKVIYLTKEELHSIQALELTGNNAYLDAVRDVFLYCCFTGLRHSDVYNLQKNDIKGDHMVVTTIKTADTIFIELNSVTRSILEKYKDIEFEEGKALPVIQNQPMNRDLKILCRLAGINEEVKIITYKGNQRQEVTKQKWELIGTHTGRRTFIVNALSLGIPPNVVMKWTGHNDYKSMKPYIDIVDSIKAISMSKFDSLL